MYCIIFSDKLQSSYLDVARLKNLFEKLHHIKVVKSSSLQDNLRPFLVDADFLIVEVVVGLFCRPNMESMLLRSLDTALGGVLLVQLRALAEASEQDVSLDISIGEGGMVFLEVGVTAYELVHGFGGGAVVTVFGETLVFLAEPLVLIIHEELVSHAPNIVNRDFIERIDALEPVAVELKHSLVKGGVVSVGADDRVGFEVTAHLRADIAELVKSGEMRAHGENIERALVGVVSSLKQRQVMPNLLDDKLTAQEMVAGFGVDDNIADIVTKRLVEGSGFGVKNTDVHGKTSFFNCQKGLTSFPFCSLSITHFRIDCKTYF